MFQDARKIARNTTLDYDIAIIDGGAAGITIAREFANSDLRVAVIERVLSHFRVLSQKFRRLRI